MKLGVKIALGLGVAAAAVAGIVAAARGSGTRAWPFGTVSGTVLDPDGERRPWNLVRLGDSASAPWRIERLDEPIEGPGGGAPGSGAMRAMEGLFQYIEENGYSGLYIEGAFGGTDHVMWAVEEGPQGWQWMLLQPPGSQEESLHGPPQADVMAAVWDLDRYASEQGWGF